MSRTLVIGDIHGGLKALMQVFERAKITSTDTLIFLGDYVDGWSQSPEVLSYLINLENTNNCIFLKGNHDALLLEWLEKSKDNKQWYKHGGEATVNAYLNINSETKLQHIQFLKNLKNYYLDNFNRLFVHAGFTNVNGIEYEYFPALCYWDRTLWETALATPESLDSNHIFFPNRLKLYSEIYIGHTPTIRIEIEIPFSKHNVWNIDTGAAFKGKLSIIDIETKKYWQSENLPTLYPLEKGRN